MQIPTQNPTEGDRLVTRLLTAFQAEKGLDEVSVEGVGKIFSELQSREMLVEQYALPSSEGELRESLRRLESAGYVSVDRTNPHVSVELTGFLSCGILSIPSEVSDAFQEKLNSTSLK